MLLKLALKTLKFRNFARGAIAVIENGQPIYLPRYADWEDYLLLIQAPPTPVDSFSVLPTSTEGAIASGHCFQEGDHALVAYVNQCAALQIACGTVFAASSTQFSIDAVLDRPRSGCLIKPINLQGFYLEGRVDLLGAFGLGQVVAGSKKIFVQGGSWSTGDRVNFPAAGLTNTEVLSVFPVPPSYEGDPPCFILFVASAAVSTVAEAQAGEITKVGRSLPIEFRAFDPMTGGDSDRCGMVQARIPESLTKGIPGPASCGACAELGCYQIVLRRGYVNPDPERYRNPDGSPMVFSNWSRAIAEGRVFSYGV